MKFFTTITICGVYDYEENEIQEYMELHNLNRESAIEAIAEEIKYDIEQQYIEATEVDVEPAED